MQYENISKSFLSELDESVNAAIKDGWEVSGPLIVVDHVTYRESSYVRGDMRYTYIQTMIKKD
ncbi:hypothetical protein PP740_gp020 [Stenotrophomonas phage Philippe]|uniref:DUF1737 domain-containing protein n=1 Tax=Stenotrophomonas phage Philippe TaxID=2859655 RepID=A0AAE7WN04_9CAUD|nr:hypothetical protein PP740_gp020 [Stenotrophomonas phage Philippe]QYW02219.1 hypothetical protein CPT_Philippe_020 [Stenotrophomonas phage Philippe]